MTDIRQGDSGSNRDSTLILLLENNIRRLLIDSDSEALQFILDDLLIDQRLIDVEHDEN